MPTPVHKISQRVVLLLFVALARLCVQAPAQTPPECMYAVTDLGTLGGPSANAMGLNQLGQAVGWADGTVEAHAFLWTDGMMIDLGTLDVGTYSEAYDVNDLGEVVGWSERDPLSPTTDWHAFLWANGDMIDLGTLGGAQSLAYAVNNVSQVVGRSDIPENPFDQRGFFWDSGVMYDLGSFDGPATGTSSAGDINNSSQVIGGASGGPNGGDSFIWENGVMTPFPWVDGERCGVAAINDSGQVACHSFPASEYEAYLWDSNGFTFLGNGTVIAANGLGHVLGGPTQTIPKLWRDGFEFLLNDCLVPNSGWTLIRANDINDAGQIVGYGFRQGFPGTRAFILDPCPAESQPGKVVWDADANSALRASRTLTISLAAARTATCFTENPTAIRVELLELQNPNPANPPCCPAADFSAYESATCTAVGEENGCGRWVGPPVTVLESQGNPALGSYQAARLQCTPYYTDWTTVGTFSIVGAEIMPSSTYELVAYAGSCMGAESTCMNVSAAVQTMTRRSGDVAASYNPPSTSSQPDALDVVAMVNKFRNLPTAPSKRISQLQPNVLELNVDVNALDIVSVVDAFRGLAYSFSGPCPCPSNVTCNAAPCTSPTPCGGGMCVKTCNAGAHAGQPCLTDAHCPGSTCGAGFCRDRCGRCG